MTHHSNEGYPRWAFLLWCTSLLGGTEGEIIDAINLLKTDPTKTIKGYDCHHEDTLFNTISLQSPATCPEVESNYEKPFSQDFQILQTMDQLPVDKAFRCQMQVTKAVNRCAWDRNNVISINYPLWNQNVKISDKDCREAYRKQAYSYEGKELTFTLGEPSKYTYWSHGKISNDGWCTWFPKFVSEGVIYEWSAQQIMVTILVEDVQGIYDMMEETVTFPKFGITTSYKTKFLQDWEAGTIMWVEAEQDCKRGSSEVYRGAAWVHKKASQLGEYLDAIVLINSSSTNQYAGLIVKEVNRYCGRTCYKTHIRHLNLCPWTEPIDKTTVNDNLFNPSADTTNVNIQSQLGHMHFTTHLEVSEAFRRVAQAMCELDRKTLSNKLQAIAGESTPYALMDLYGPGYTSYISGAVAYIAQCVPIQVVRAEYPNCTQEIPVKYNGDPMFMNPITRIIQRHPTVVPCSDIMQIRWEIEGKWFCATPTIRTCEAPMQFEPLAPRKTDIDFTTGMGRGIYTDDQLKAHLRFDHARTTRQPILARIATQAADNANNRNGGLGTMLGTVDMKEVETVLTPLWFPMLWSLGNIWHYLTGIGFLYVIIKIVCGFFIRSYGLYTRRGWGLWLFGAITDTTFMIATFPVSVMKGIFEKNPMDRYESKEMSEIPTGRSKNNRKPGSPRGPPGGQDASAEENDDFADHTGVVYRKSRDPGHRSLHAPQDHRAEKGELAPFVRPSAPPSNQNRQRIPVNDSEDWGTGTRHDPKGVREMTHRILGDKVRAAHEDLLSANDRVGTELRNVARKLLTGRAASTLNLTDDPSPGRNNAGRNNTGRNNTGHGNDTTQHQDCPPHYADAAEDYPSPQYSAQASQLSGGNGGTDGPMSPVPSNVDGTTPASPDAPEYSSPERSATEMSGYSDSGYANAFL